MPADSQYIRMPDGGYVQFPGSMADEDIKAALKKSWKAPQSYTYRFEDKTYTVPAGTSLDDLDQFIKSQDPLRSGESMVENAQRQATERLAKQIQSRRDPTETVGHYRLAERVGRPELERHANAALPVLEGTAAAAGAAMPFIEAGGLLPGLKLLTRTTAGSALGAKAGEWAGSAFGDTGRKIGRIAGGLYGGYRGAKGLELPERYGFMRDLFGSPDPAEAATTSTVGEEPATSGVNVVPEPRPVQPGEKPGAMYSVQRKTDLMDAARRGKPGAIDVLRDLGSPSVLIPREGVGYPGPRVGAPYLSPEELDQVMRPRYRPAAD